MRKIKKINSVFRQVVLIVIAIDVVVCTVCKYLPPETGLLQPAVKLLSDWCRVLSAFPVVTWSSFVDYIRSRVNLLATEQQVRELVHQLVVIGEVGLTVIHVLKVFSPSGSTTILVSHITQDGSIPTGTPLAGASNARWYEKITIFYQYRALSQN